MNAPDRNSFGQTTTLNSKIFMEKVKSDLDLIPEVDATPIKGVSKMIEKNLKNKSLKIRPNIVIKGSRVNKSILSLKPMA